MANYSASLSEGNDAFLAEDYKRALELYSKVLEEDDKVNKAYEGRAKTNLKLGNYKDAKSDTQKSIELGNNDPDAYLFMGTACYWLSEFAEAKEAFNLGKQKSENKESFDIWLEKCEAELIKKSSSLKKANGTSSNIKQDWYQTEADVVVSLMVKGLKNDEVSLNISSDTVNVIAELPNKERYELSIDLAHSVNPHKSSWKVLSSKIEIKLKKDEGIRWSSLRKSKSSLKDISSVSASKPTTSPSYPSSAPSRKDWDKIAQDIKKEEEDETLQGDAALNQLFQKIYKDGNDEVRRAMNKSFMESGGTVLSTNWSEVGDKAVDVKPPDGMEYKKWES